MIFLQMYDNPVQAFAVFFFHYFYYAGLHKNVCSRIRSISLYQLILLQYKPFAVSVHQIPLPRFLSARTLSKCICSGTSFHATLYPAPWEQKTDHMDFQDLSGSYPLASMISSLWQISYPFKVVNNLPIPLEYNTSFWYLLHRRNWCYSLKHWHLSYSIWCIKRTLHLFNICHSSSDHLLWNFSRNL